MSRFAALASCAALLAWPQLAAAVEEAHHGPNWGMLGLQVLNTGILLFILYRFARPPLLGFLKQRSEAIAGRIADAQARLEEARGELASWQARLDRIDEESAQILASAEQRARVQAERALTRAQQASERIREEARAVADQEIERARRALRRETSQLALALAGELLRENLGPEDDRRLVATFADRIEERS